VNAEIIESGFDFCIRHHDPLKCENRNLTIGPRARKVLLQLNANSVNLSSAIGVSGKAQSALCITGGYGETGRRYILDIPFNNHPARTGPRWHARRAFPSSPHHFYPGHPWIHPDFILSFWRHRLFRRFFSLLPLSLLSTP
jgi:hypothetical protein